MRPIRQGVSEVPVQLKKLLQATASDVPLQAEDILFVPTSAKMTISGETAVMEMATAASIVAIRPWLGSGGASYY
jgi:hypothetical protein